jgi:multiple sugar transport system permease protein
MYDARPVRRAFNAARLRRRVVKGFVWLGRTAFVVGICFMILYPLFTKLSMSFMEQVDLYDKTVQSIPKHFTWMNYPEAMQLMNYGRALLSTSGICFLSAACQAFACVLTGYGFARFQFKFRGPLFALVIVMMVIPPQIILTPLYLNFQNFDPFGLISLVTGGKGLRLTESVPPFLLISLTATGPRSGLYIFLARQFSAVFPAQSTRRLHRWGFPPRVFFSIMLPAALPIFTTIFLFAFVWLWNDNMYAFLFYSNLPTMAKALLSMDLQFSQIHVDMSAAASDIGYFAIMKSTGVLLVILPLIVLFACLQKVCIRSIERTGMVG